MPHTATHRQFRPRIERLPLQSLKDDLAQTLQSSFIAERLPGGRGDIDRVLNVIEDTGTIPGDVVQLWQNWPNPEERKDLLNTLNNLQNIASKLPSARQVVESLKTPEAIASEAGLTERELKERAAALGELSGESVTNKKVNDITGLKNEIIRIAKEYTGSDNLNVGATDEAIEQAALRAADELFSNNFSSQRFAENIRQFSPEGEIGHGEFETLKDLGNVLNTKLNNRVAKGQFLSTVTEKIPAIETGADVSRIQDILGARRARAAGKQQIESFVTGLPEELAGGRRPLIEAERQAGTQFLEQELFPEIKEKLAIRGLQFGGDLPFELARAAGGVQRGVEQLETGLATEDDIFFQNAAYQNTLTKALEAGQDVGFEIATQRGLARAGQEQRFSTRLGELAGQRELEIFRRQQERALAVGTERLRRQQEAERSKSQAGLFESIFTPALQIGTSFALGKAFGPKGGGITT